MRSAVLSVEFSVVSVARRDLAVLWSAAVWVRSVVMRVSSSASCSGVMGSVVSL